MNIVFGRAISSKNMEDPSHLAVASPHQEVSIFPKQGAKELLRVS